MILSPFIVCNSAKALSVRLCSSQFRYSPFICLFFRRNLHNWIVCNFYYALSFPHPSRPFSARRAFVCTKGTHVFLLYVPVFLISARDSLFPTKDEHFMCYTIYIHLSQPLQGIHTKETAQTLIVSQLANCFAFTDGYMAKAFVPNVFIQQIIFHCNVCLMLGVRTWWHIACV